MDAESIQPSELTGASKHALDGCAGGELSSNVALARLAIAGAADAGSIDRVLCDAIRDCLLRGADIEAHRLLHALALLRRAPETLSTLAAIASDHDRPRAAQDDPVVHWAAVFDRACARSPEASVALYSLGRSDLLEKATQEIVAWLDEADLLGPQIDILDLGCGIGRMLEPLATRVRFVVGIEVSPAMAQAASSRAAGLANAAVLRTSGRDLAAFGDGGFDLVLAIDVFPYLVAGGDDPAMRHIAEAGRVLRRGGVLVIFNYSYRGRLDRDRADLAQFAARHRLAFRDRGACGFRLWDAVAFELRRQD